MIVGSHEEDNAVSGAAVRLSEPIEVVDISNSDVANAFLALAEDLWYVERGVGPDELVPDGEGYIPVFTLHVDGVPGMKSFMLSLHRFGSGNIWAIEYRSGEWPYCLQSLTLYVCNSEDAMKRELATIADFYMDGSEWGSDLLSRALRDGDAELILDDPSTWDV